jgi:hypothetical protein
MRRINLMILAFLFSTLAYSQLVNIESKRMQTDSIRFVLKNDFSFSYNNNDGDYIYQIGNNLSAQVKSKDLKKIYFLIGNYNLIRSENQDFQNSWFLHFRFNQKISNLFRFEAFIQSLDNELLVVNSRQIIGAGLRFKFISTENARLYLGNAYMYEYEKSDAFKNKDYHHRNSSYLSLTASIPKSNINILNTIYYQPLYSDFSDFRISEQFKIEVPLSKALRFNTLFSYYYDSITPSGKKQFWSNISVGLGVEL